MSITGGRYQINGGAWTSATGSVQAGDTIMLEVISGASIGAINTATLTLGNVTQTFSVTAVANGAPLPSVSSGGGSSGGGGGGGNTWTVYNPSTVSNTVNSVTSNTNTSKSAVNTEIPLTIPKNCKLPSKTNSKVKAPDISGHWAEPALRDAISYGFIKNTLLVRPNGTVTREQFVNTLLKMFPCEPQGSIKVANWSDVQKGSILETNLKTLAARGWILGDSGRFRPKDPITKKEALLVLSRILKIDASAPSPTNPFLDISNDDPALARFVALKQRGIVSGRNIKPNAAITLAEFINYFDIAFWNK